MNEITDIPPVEALPRLVTRYQVSLAQFTSWGVGSWYPVFSCATRAEAADVCATALRDPGIGAAKIDPVQVQEPPA